MRLVNKGAALMLKDNEVNEKLIAMLIKLINDETKQEEMRRNIAPLAISDADKTIAEEILNSIT
jgi:UDP-N-acetylglucosamine:LPS N-acetylglucosamine transferase